MTNRPMAAPLWLALVLMLLAVVARAEAGVAVSGAWARATVPGQGVGAAYLELASRSDAVLVKVESPAAEFVEIHKMSMTDGVMEMRMLETLPLPAGQVVRLAPGGFHLMLINLKAPLKAGDELALALHVRDAAGKVERIAVSVPVRGR